MSMSSSAYKRLCVLYRNVLQHMRELNHRLLVGYEGRVKAMSSGQSPLEQLEPRLLMAENHWTGDVDNSWKESGNWSAGVPSTGDILIFDSTAVSCETYNDLDPGASFDSIRILSGGYSFGGNGNSLTLTGGIENTSWAMVEFPIFLANGSTINSSATLTLTKAVTANGTVIKDGTGTLVLSGSDDNTGLQLTVTLGEVDLAKASSSAIHAAAQITSIGSGATVRLTGDGGDQIGNSSSIIVSGTFDVAGHNETISSLSGSGIVTNNGSGLSTLTVGYSGNSSTFGGTILDGTSSLGLSKVGSGTLTLSGANTFSGGLTVADGALSVSVINNTSQSGPMGKSASATVLGGNGTTGTLQYTGGTSSSSRTFATADGGTGIFNTSGTLTLSGVISGPGALTKTGMGVLTFTGANTFTGELTVAQGTLSVGVFNEITSSGPLGKSPSVTILGVGTLGTLQYTGGTVSSTRNFNTITSSSGGLDVSNANTILTLSGIISGQGALTKLGAGTLVLSGDNTFTGSLNVFNGTLSVGVFNESDQAGPLGMSSNGIVLGGPSSSGTLKYTGVDSPSTSRNMTVSNGGIGIVDISNANSTFTITGAIGGAGTFAKQGAGTLSLSGPNTFTGPLSIFQGTLSVGIFNASSDSGPLGKSTSPITLGSSGKSGILKYTGADSYTSNRTFTLASGGIGGLEVLNAGTNLGISGIITGSGTLTKVGAGTLTLSGANTYSGATNVSSGTLCVAAIADSGTSNIGYGTLTLSGGTLLFTGASSSTNRSVNATAGSSHDMNVVSGALTLSGQVTGSLNKQGAGTLTLAGVASNTSLALSVSAGEVDLGKTGSATAVTSIGSIASGATVKLTGGTNLISDSGNVTISGGILDLNGHDEIINGLSGTSGTVTNNSASGATLRVGNSNGTSTFSGVARSGTGALTLTKIGSGTLTLGGTADNTGLILDAQAGTVLLNKIDLEEEGLVHAVSGIADIRLGATVRLMSNDQISNVEYNQVSKAGSVGLSGGGTLDINGYQESVDRIDGSSGVITSTSAGGWLYVGNVGTHTDSRFYGDITGGLTIAKSNDGVLTLTGNNTFTGGMLVNVGVIDFLSMANLGTGIRNFSNATLRLSSGAVDLPIFGHYFGSVTFDVQNLAHLSMWGQDNYGSSSTDYKVGTGTLTLAGSRNNAGLLLDVSLGTVELAMDSSPTVHALQGITVQGGLVKITGAGGDQIANPQAGSQYASQSIAPLSAGRGDVDLSSMSVDELKVLFAEAEAWFRSQNPQDLMGATSDNSSAPLSDGQLLESASSQSIDSSLVTMLGGTFDLNGHDEEIGSLSGTSGTVTNNSITAATLAVGGDGSTSAFSGVAKSGSGELTLSKVGNGALTIGGSIENTGLKLLAQAGQVDLAKSGNAYAVAGITDIAQGATIKLATSGGSDQIADGGNVYISAGSLNLNGHSEAIGQLSGGNTAMVTSATDSSLAVTVEDPNTAEFDGVIGSGSAFMTLTKYGSGTLTLGGDQDNTGLILDVQAGTVELAKTDPNYTEMLSAASAGSDIAAGDILSDGGGPIAGTDRVTLLGMVHAAEDVNVGPGARLDLGFCGVTINTLTGSGTIEGHSRTPVMLYVASGEFSGVIEAGVMEPIAVCKTGPGTLLLSGANTYDGGTTITEGVVVCGSDTAFGTGSVTLSDLNDGVSLLYQEGADCANDIIVSSTGQGTVTLGALGEGWDYTLSGTITLGRDTIIEVYDATTGMTFSGTVTATGSVTATKTGCGVLTLSGASQNSGLKLDVQGGEVNLAKTGGYAVASIACIADGATVIAAGENGDQIDNHGSVNLSKGGTFDLYGQNETISQILGSGKVTNSLSTVAALTIGSSDADSRYDGSITGHITLKKIGNGTVTFAGPSTYTGGTTISQGTILAENNSALGTNDVVLGDSGTAAAAIALLSGNGADLANNITISFNGTGTATIGTAGGDKASVFGGVITLNRSTSIQAENTAGTTFTNAVVGPSTITKTGSGNLTLSGSNDYTGEAVISNGTLLASTSLSVGSGFVTLKENDSFLTSFAQSLTIPANATSLTVSGIAFHPDLSDSDSMRDAFEVALVDSQGWSLIQTIGNVKDSFFNMSESGAILLAPGVSYDSGSNTISVDLTDVPAGTKATLLVRLVNNDEDTNSWLQMPASSVSGPTTIAEGSTYELNLASLFQITNSQWAINWGDGIINSLSQHTYEENGDYSITATLKDGSNGSEIYVAPTVQVVVTNVAPAVTFEIDESSILEGESVTASGSVFDPGVLDTLIAFITWGDNTDPEEIELTGGEFSVNHLYADNGLYTPTIEVSDDDRGETSRSASVSVVNSAPEIAEGVSLNIGSDGRTVTLEALFTDAGLRDTHVASIDWGDSRAGGSIQEPVGITPGTISAVHLYTAEDTYDIEVLLTDKDGGTASYRTSIYVDPPAPTIEFGTEVAYEGNTFTLDAVCNGSNVGDTYTIVWGDGEPDGSGTVTEISGQKRIVGVHTYTDEGQSDGTYIGSYLITVTVAQTITGVHYQEVDNVPPAFTHGGGDTQNLTELSEGSTFSLSAGFEDDGKVDVHTAIIEWGDGTSSPGTITESVVNGKVVGTVTGEHLYADDGIDNISGHHTYEATVTVRDQDGGSDSTVFNAKVDNVAPTLIASYGFESYTNGTTPAVRARVVGQFTDPGFTSLLAQTAETFTIEIQWGDGTSTELTQNQLSVVQGTGAEHLTIGAFSAVHDYAATGQVCNVSVVVTDDDRGSNESSQQQFQFVIVDLTCDKKLNLKSNETVPVTIDWAGSSINANSLRFGPAGASGTLSGNVATFRMGETGIQALDQVAFLSGMFTGGTSFVGVAKITLVNGSDLGSSGIKPQETKYLVADGAAYRVNKIDYHTLFGYKSDGTQSGNFNYAAILDTNDNVVSRPLGIEMSSDRSTVWILNENISSVGKSEVIVLKPTLSSFLEQQGTWMAQGVTSPTGITSHGDDIWMVDAYSKKVVRFVGAATIQNGIAAGVDEFVLEDDNANPSDLVTDGTLVWVCNDSPSGNDEIFVYEMNGSLVGRWQVDTQNAGISGITIDGSDIVAIDRVGKASYRYAGGTLFRGGQHSASSDPNALSMTHGPTDPEAISDPPGTTSQMGMSAMQTASPAQHDASVRVADYSLLTDVSSLFSQEYTITSWNRQSSVLYADLELAYTGQQALRGPIVVGIKNISRPDVTVHQPDGVTPDGVPYFIIASLDPQSKGTVELAFDDPFRMQFDYELEILGQFNHAPAFTSVPVVEVKAGNTYSYSPKAVDPDGDKVEYSLISAPEGMSLLNGLITWSPNIAGQYQIAIRVQDESDQAFSDQAFILSVVDMPNRPPTFTSQPVVDAYVHTQYVYQVAATDPDMDTLTYAVTAEGPAGYGSVTGLAVSNEGRVTWTPPAELVDTLVTVTVSVRDRINANDPQVAFSTQGFSIYVHPQVGNHDPIIISEPNEHHALPLYSDPSTDQVTPTAINLDLAPGEQKNVPLTITLDLPEGSNPPPTGPEDVLSVTKNINVQNLIDSLLGNGSTGLNIIGGTSSLSYTEWTGYNGLLYSTGTFVNNATAKLPSGDDVSLPTYNMGHSGIVLSTGSVSDYASITDEEMSRPSPLYWRPNEGRSNGSNNSGSVNEDHKVNDPVVERRLDDITNTTGIDYEHYDCTVLTFQFTVDEGIDEIWFNVVFGSEEYPLWLWDPNDPGKAYIDGFGIFLNDSNIAVTPSGDNAGEPININNPDMEDTYDESIRQWRYMWANRTELGGVIAPEDANGEPNPVLTFHETVRASDAANPVNTLTFIIADSRDDRYDTTVFIDSLSTTPPNTVTVQAVGDGAELFKNVTGPILTDLGGTLSFQGQFTGDGQAHSLSLEFVDQHGELLGTIPATLNAGYFYPVKAIDPDGDKLKYSLIQTPDTSCGTASIDPDSGLMEWAPTQMGTYTFTVRVTDGNGGHVDQTFDVVVASDANNADPAFGEDTSGTIAQVGRQYSYSPKATDDDGDRLRYYLVQSGGSPVPSGMSIDQNTGSITWSPIATGDVPITVKVTDGRGGSDEKTFSIHVNPLGFGNNAPSIVAIADQTVQVGADLSPLQVIATDYDDDRLQYDLVTKPAGMAIDPESGMILWSPSEDQVGTHPVIVRVMDGQGGTSLMPWQVKVIPVANHSPEFRSVPIEGALVNEGYSYTINVSDQDNDWVTLCLEAGNNALEILNNRYLVWSSDPPDQPGSYAVSIKADDGNGGINYQSFTLTVDNEHTFPVFPSFIRDKIQLGQTYVFKLTETDYYGRACSYYLSEDAPSGMGVAGDLLKWTPTEEDIGTHSFSIICVVNGTSTSKAVELEVTSDPTNTGPTITSSPVTGAVANRLYCYDLLAGDAENDWLEWSLVHGPDGMAIDSASGQLVWKPTTTDVGQHPVTVKVTDIYGGYSTQEFTLTVRGASAAPYIISKPITQVKVSTESVHTEYAYQVVAVDPDGDKPLFSLIAPASGMTIDDSGLLTWTAGTSPANLPIEIRVYDEADPSMYSEQMFTLEVSSSDPKPEFTSYPNAYASVGREYYYNVTVAYPSDVTYQLDEASMVRGLTIDPAGAITWAANSITSAKVGDWPVIVTATKGSLSNTQAYVLHVQEDAAPVFAVSDQQLTFGRVFSLLVTASDPDSESILKFDLPACPDGMRFETVSSDSIRILWWPTDVCFKGTTQNVTVMVTDQCGVSASHTFAIDVLTDRDAPVVAITAPKSADINKWVSIHVRATDNVGVVSRQAFIKMPSSDNGTPISIGQDGWANLLMTEVGVIEIQAIATDAQGLTTTETAYIDVSDPDVVIPPALSFISPTGDEEIDVPTDVMATISDANGSIVSYELQLAREGGEFVTLVTGAGSNPVYRLDPTLLRGGSYWLRLIATDNDGNSSTLDKAIQIGNDLKLGNFSLSFVDLVIPVLGIPVTIQRTYDTLQSENRMDFGYGWSASISVAKLDIPQAAPDPESVYNVGPMKIGSRFTVTLPDGTKEGFSLSMKLVEYDVGDRFASEMAGTILAENLHLWQPYFEADPGNTSKLDLSQANMTCIVTDNGDCVLIDGSPFNPASADLEMDYVITTGEGAKYRFDGRTGQLKPVEDRNGNTLTITDSAVIACDKDGNELARIKLTRERGRIVAVTDPAGKSISYGYDAYGDLANMTNRTNDMVQFRYLQPADSGYQPHYLSEIVDPRGVTVMKVHYNATTGRLESIDDATGSAAGSFGYTIEGQHVQKTVDNAGDITELVSDDKGNVIRRIQHVNPSLSEADRSYFETVYEYYPDSSRLHREGVPFTTDYDHKMSSVPSLWAATYEYDQYGYVCATTDALGNITRQVNDQYGNPLSSIDATGVASTNEYDPATGNLVKSTVGGSVTKYVYEDNRLTQIIQVDEGGNGIITSAMSYDERGRISSITDVNHVTRYFVYDDNGNQTDSYSDRQVGSETMRIIDHTVYDHEGRVTETSQIVQTLGANGSVSASETLWTASTTYTAGLVTASKDRFGNETENTYDALGYLIQTRTKSRTETDNLVWLVTRTAYDSSGRVIATTDPFVTDLNGNQITSLGDIRVTQTHYDSLGRADFVYRVAGVAVTLEPDPDHQNLNGDPAQDLYRTQFDTGYDSSALLSHTQTHYDNAGQVDYTVAASGARTSYTYDGGGRLLSTTQDLDGDPATISNLADHFTVTSYRYDAAGRQQYVDQDLDDTAATTGDNYTTRYDYDGQGRLVKTTYPDFTTTSIQYDSQGHRISQTDQMGQTTYYRYDNAGRLTAVILPAVPAPEAPGTLTHPRYEYEYDAYGNQTATCDNIRQSDPSDDATIDRANKRTTSYEYDEFNRLTKHTLPLGTATTIDTDFVETKQYDDRSLADIPGTDLACSTALGQLKYEVSFEGRVTAYLYDNRPTGGGRLVQKLYYTSVGAYTDYPDDPAQTIAYAYDAFGRQKVVADSLGGQNTYQYSDEGQLTQVDSPQGIVNYVYDPVTGLHTRTYTGNEAAPISDISYGYDKLGRLTSVTVVKQGGLTVNQQTLYTYDSRGNLHRQDLANGVISLYQYDALSRLTDLTQYGPDATPEDPEDLSDNPVLADYTYTLRPDGKRSGVVEIDKNGIETDITWEYDNSGRLTAESYEPVGDLYHTYDARTVYAFDLVGNRLSKKTYGKIPVAEEVYDWSPDCTSETEYSYDGNDRLLTEKILDSWGAASQTTVYAYGDGADPYEGGGNGTSVTNRTVWMYEPCYNMKMSETDYAYGVRGHLAQVAIDSDADGVADSREEYQYDDNGIRVATINYVDNDEDGTLETPEETDFLVDPVNPTGYVQVLEEWTGGTSPSRSYVIGLDVIAQADDTNGLLYLIADGHGSTRLLVDGSSAPVVVQAVDYDAYGNLLNTSLQPLTTLLYNKQQTSVVTGMQYLRARYYLSSIGRMLTEDPYSGNSQDPISVHRYLYANADPIMASDPTGKWTLMETLGVVSIVGLLTVISWPTLQKAKSVSQRNWYAAHLHELANVCSLNMDASKPMQDWPQSIGTIDVGDPLLKMAAFSFPPSSINNENLVLSFLDTRDGQNRPILVLNRAASTHAVPQYSDFTLFVQESYWHTSPPSSRNHWHCVISNTAAFKEESDYMIPISLKNGSYYNGSVWMPTIIVTCGTPLLIQTW